MSYQLQPGLLNIEQSSLPTNPATDAFVVPPQPSSLHYFGRPNTMLYGTAPYRAGKGAPNSLIELDDTLRPQSTSQFKKIYVDTYEQQVFPLNKIPCNEPIESHVIVPGSTRSDNQNAMYAQRYLGN